MSIGIAPEELELKEQEGSEDLVLEDPIGPGEIPEEFQQKEEE